MAMELTITRQVARREVKWAEAVSYVLSQNPPPFQEVLRNKFNVIPLSAVESRGSIHVVLEVPSIKSLDTLWERSVRLPELIYVHSYD